MKCIKSNATGDVKRVSESIATHQVGTGTFSFVPKKEWKDIRGAVKNDLPPDPDREREVARRAEKLKNSKTKKNYKKI